MLAKHIKRCGKTYLLRTHPSSDNFFGIKGGEYLFLEGKKAHFAASLFYLVDVIRSITFYAWRRVDYVIFVRYLMGTAYLPAPIHKFAYHFFSMIVPTKGHLIYLNVTPAEAFRRLVNNRTKMERFESLDELSKTSYKALDLVSYGRWRIIDGDRSIHEIQEEILEVTGLKPQPT